MLNRDSIIETLKKNKDMFHDRYGVTALYLYGSFSRDRASATSDVDLLLDVPRQFKKFKYYMEMKRFLQDTFKREVDLVYSDSLNPVIKEEIKGETIKIE